MTPRQAAKVIGCTATNVRTLINRGRLSAVQVPCAYGFTWDLDPKDVTRYARKPQGRGYPRGRKRKAD